MVPSWTLDQLKLFCFGQTSCQELECLLIARLLPLSPEGGESRALLEFVGPW